MIGFIDEALEALLRATVPLSARDVDVSFDAPDREWSAKLTRPTVNLFLRDIRRSTEGAKAGLEQVEQDGRQVRRPALPRVELRYLITVWTSDLGDERSLLSGVLRCVLAHEQLPGAFAPAGLSGLPPARLAIPRDEDTSTRSDGAQALDGQMKPALHLSVIAAVDVGLGTPVGPPTEVIETHTAGRDGSRQPPTGPTRRVAGEVADRTAVGATVRSPHGVATVDETGRFLVRAAIGDEVVIESDPPKVVVVPSVGGIEVS